MNFKFFENDYKSDEEAIYCSGCGKPILDEYYYDKNTEKVYCSKECYINKIEKDYLE